MQTVWSDAVDLGGRGSLRLDLDEVCLVRSVRFGRRGLDGNRLDVTLFVRLLDPRDERIPLLLRVANARRVDFRRMNRIPRKHQWLLLIIHD